MIEITETVKLASSCPVCSAAVASPVWTVQPFGSYQVVGCSGCGLAFILPRPTAAELSDFYSQAYLEGDQYGYQDYTFLPELNMKRMWRDLRKYAPLDSIKPRSLLDVGCATGSFLSQAQADGWDCIGVDPIEEAVSRARSEYKLDARAGDIFSVHEPSRFGLLTMWHVIEHVTDPIAVLEQANRLLAPGGWLFLETPNWQSMGRIVKGSGWSQIRPPEHINFFDAASLSYAATKAGFEIMRCGSVYPVVVDRNFFRSPKRIIMSALGKAASILNHGCYLRLLARRG